MTRRGRRRRVAGALAVTLAALAGGLLLLWPTPAAAPSTVAADLVVLDWPDDIPQAVLDDFAAQHHITVQLVTYRSLEEANRVLEAMPAYDVAVVEHQYIPALAGAGKLYPLNLRDLPNFKYVDPTFRNLSFDPTNHFSVPFSWGCTGLVARTGFFTETHPSWSRLWDDRLANGKVVLWRNGGNHAIAATLKKLGYSANSEDPQALAAAKAELMRLRPSTRVFDTLDYQEYAVPFLLGQIDAAIGNTEDYMGGREVRLPIQFWYPAEGALMWGDSFVVPANSHDPALAAKLINTFLDPKVAAQIMEHNHLRIANDGALAYASPALRAEYALFPDLDTLRNGELILPLSPQGAAARKAVWAEFLAGQK